MKIQLLLLFATLTTTLASDVLRELNILNERYDKAIQEAITPIDARYLEELEKLLKKASDERNTEAILAIGEKIKQTQKTTTREKERYSFVGSMWVSPFNTKYSFTNDGRGVQEKNGSMELFKWEKMREGVFKIIIESSGKLLFFKQNSDNDLLMGVSSDVLDQRLSKIE